MAVGHPESDFESIALNQAFQRNGSKRMDRAGKPVPIRLQREVYYLPVRLAGTKASRPFAVHGLGKRC